MVEQQSEPQSAETVRKIAEHALSDAVEITLLIALIKEQNAGRISKKLNEAGAGNASKVLRNALIARLVTLVARAYAKPKDGDMHLRVAVNLLMNNTTRQIFEAGGGAAKLIAFDEHWAKCRGDHRLPWIKQFRDKYTAHLGEPEDIQEATYRDLFELGAATAKAMELLALATRVAVNPIDTDSHLITGPKTFWAHWQQK